MYTLPCRQRLLLLLGSRRALRHNSCYKSLYPHLTVTDHENLQGLASDLFKHDVLKYKSLQQCTSFMEMADVSDDWREVHDSTITFGTPELADHLSGYIYMSASMYEDKWCLSLVHSDIIMNKEPRVCNPIF